MNKAIVVVRNGYATRKSKVYTDIEMVEALKVLAQNFFLEKEDGNVVYFGQNYIYDSVVETVNAEG